AGPDYETINRIIAFAVHGIEPDLCIVLDAPVATLLERLQNRPAGERFDNLDEAFLERVRAGYLWEAKQRNMPVVFATDTVDATAEAIWKLVVDTLAIRDPSRADSNPTALKEIIQAKTVAAPVAPPPAKTAPLLDTKHEATDMTPAGRTVVESAVTNLHEDVFAFTGQLDSTHVTTGLVTFAQTGGDVRLSLLDEKASSNDPEVLKQ